MSVESMFDTVPSALRVPTHPQLGRFQDSHIDLCSYCGHKSRPNIVPDLCLYYSLP